MSNLKQQLQEALWQKCTLTEQPDVQSSELANLKAQLRGTIESARFESDQKQQLIALIDMMQATGLKLTSMMEERFTGQQNTIEWSMRIANLLMIEVLELKTELDRSKANALSSMGHLQKSAHARIADMQQALASNMHELEASRQDMGQEQLDRMS